VLKFVFAERIDAAIQEVAGCRASLEETENYLTKMIAGLMGAHFGPQAGNGLAVQLTDT
jgi:hypothetical protein